MDNSKEITCSVCGFFELPTAFELIKHKGNTGWEIAKIMIIILAGIAFVLVGIPVIALSAFFVPIILVAVIAVILYQRWKRS